VDKITPLVHIEICQFIAVIYLLLPSATKLPNTAFSNCSFLASKIQEKLFMAPLMLGLPLSRIFLWLH
jgi:hypothetical protein